MKLPFLKFVLIILLLIRFNYANSQVGSNDAYFNPIDSILGQGTGAGNTVSAIAIQSDGKIVIGGFFTTYNGTSRNYIARINTDGSLDTGFDPGTGANAEILSITIQSDGKILIGGGFTSYNGTARSRIARINADGSLDTGFDPGTGSSGNINAIAIQSDGKIVIAGNITIYNGTPRNRIARINADGSLDNGFDPGTGASTSINTIAIQSDGKIVIGGSFTSYNGTVRNRIARINADGSLDTGFDPGTGAGSNIEAMAMQSDGKIVIGGDFTTYNSTVRNRIARINTDGTLDTGFDPGTGATGKIGAMAIQSDGKIVIGGSFTSYNGTSRNRIARINAEGSLDTGFDPGTGAIISVSTIAIQSDGKIVIGGGFTRYSGTSRNYIARINTDGSLDFGFDPAMGANSSIFSIAIQSDGKIVIGGGFTSYNGTARSRIARINADGSLDAGFDPGNGGIEGLSAINDIAIQSDGKIVIGGSFTTYNGTVRNRIARINSDGSLDTGFDPGNGGNNQVRAIAIQSDGKILIGGYFTSYNFTTRRRIARINADGSLDTGFEHVTGVGSNIEAMAMQSDGKIVIGGDFTTYNSTVRNRIARINTDGTLDTGFDPGTGANGTIIAMAIQSDGKIVIGGSFTSYNGTSRNRIARINADGSLDTGFDPGNGTDELGIISAIAIQSDGKIVIGGGFTSYNGTSRNRIARINADGSLDTVFDPSTGAGSGSINAIVIQSDGKIVIGGNFTTYNGITRTRIARILTCSTPTVSANSSSPSLCIGESVTLSGSGASTYTWQPGNLTGSPSVSPNTTTIYTVTGTSSGGCTNTATYLITVNTLPSVGINSSASSICDGLSATLEGAGANTYTWQPGNLSGSPVVSPTSNTTYTVIGTDANGCTNTATYSLTVNALPNVSINSSASTICTGASATLSGTGASTYTWQPGNLSGSPVVSPTSNTIYTVVGTDANGCTNSSTTLISIYAPGNPLCTQAPCGIPTSISATPTHNSVVINFTKALSSTSTFIQTRVKGTANWGGTSVAGESLTINYLTPNTTYEYRLRSSCTGSNSAFTNISEFTTNTAPPIVLCSAPTGISSTVNGNTSVTINWTPANNGALYFVQLKPSASTWAQAGGASTASTSITFNYLQSGTAYDYRIRTTCTAATTSNGRSTFSPENSFTTTGAPGVALFNTDNSDWSIYPNPTKDLVQVEFTSSVEAPMTIMVFDVTGRMVQSIATQTMQGYNQLDISLGTLSNGMYIIKTRQNDEINTVGKVLKQ